MAKEKESPKPSGKLTMWQANILVALLAGFWARPSDGHPGPQILAEGLRILHALVCYEANVRRTRKRRRPPT